MSSGNTCRYPDESMDQCLLVVLRRTLNLTVCHAAALTESRSVCAFIAHPAPAARLTWLAKKINTKDRCAPDGVNPRKTAGQTSRPQRGSGRKDPGSPV